MSRLSHGSEAQGDDDPTPFSTAGSVLAAAVQIKRPHGAAVWAAIVRPGSCRASTWRSERIICVTMFFDDLVDFPNKLGKRNGNTAVSTMTRR